ncbi:gluconokinase [Hymenobacter negativus]|uniref:Gluconokinase n=1 Tax=Hymenobacter negativus TaxID=2795026 RepID=A0ABS0Q8D8_9BACT|nr:gluconokinase [Hymenobacter negativus]MBH8558835.1 gluconokinase [Hymenobacter negativus]
MSFIVMGVSGCGKTTVGELLAKKLNLPFYDADDFHSQANIDKMAHGTPLTDEDRSSWLATLATKLGEWEKAGGAILACSALKEKYRDTLQSKSTEPLHWVFLDGPKELLLERISGRKGHYMHSNMLDSQLATLERPAYALRLSITSTPEELMNQIATALEKDPTVGTKPGV